MALEVQSILMKPPHQKSYWIALEHSFMMFYSFLKYFIPFLLQIILKTLVQMAAAYFRLGQYSVSILFCLLYCSCKRFKDTSTLHCLKQAYCKHCCYGWDISARYAKLHPMKMHLENFDSNNRLYYLHLYLFVSNLKFKLGKLSVFISDF